MAGLRSKLFAGDARLEACLVDNAKHVTLGDRGTHVSKIQFAVLMLESGVTIPGSELDGKLYGPRTANAILVYKTRRQIINKSYQNAPDNIVGIMTIRALDDEMVLSEIRDSTARIRT